MSHSCRRNFGVSVFMHNSVMSRFLIGDKQEAKFRGVMSAQNTHHIPAFYRFFDSCHLVISAFIVIYLILSFLCISREKGGIWKLCWRFEERDWRRA